ncbi:hypothetical protein WJX84_005505 [Apatococcus fuscideae]|uniref:Cytochrome b561 domain-containing protein n=1 Tax=Apatococcus fuscideae TaxID=2026836 RepID=A0AAW1T292_9CHLO
MVIAAFVLAVTRFGAPPRHHYSIGVAAFALMLSQPLTSIPRLCLHHGQVLRNPFFAWLHWTIGRGAVVFGWVNIFFGFGEFRRNFGLGSWPQVAFGLYLGVLVLVCLVLESRLWHQSASRQRQREDDLSRRIAALSAISTRGISGRKSKHLDSDEDDDLLVGAQPQQSLLFGPEAEPVSSLCSLRC